MFGKDYGLKINKEKSACLVFNGRIDREENSLGGIRVMEGMKYLGVEVSAKKDCFGGNRKKKIGVAEGMANVTYSVVARACERLMIGKVFWKSVVLPCVLSSAEVMVWRKAER